MPNIKLRLGGSILLFSFGLKPSEVEVDTVFITGFYARSHRALGVVLEVIKFGSFFFYFVN